MTLREHEQRVVILKQQLTLIQRYPNHFKKKLGKKGTENLVNSILDEMIEHIQWITENK